MAYMTLRYGEDPATGLPHLEGQNGSLSAADLEVLQRALDPHFERLANGPDGQLFALNGLAGPELPRYFRVTVTEREKRCPTLLLEAAEPPVVDAPSAASEAPAPAALPAGPGRWQGQFLAEVAELLAGGAGDGATRSPLDFVLGDLRALWRKDPHKFTLLLFAGYLHVGDALSLRHGEPGDNRYARAAWILAQRVGDALPEGVLDPLLPEQPAPAPSEEPAAIPPEEPAAVPPEEPRSWLRRFFSFP